LALLLLACAINGLRDPQANHPIWLLAACALMSAWSVCTWFWNQNPRQRTWFWMSLDVAMTLVIVGGSRFVLGEALLRDSYLGITAYWMAAAPMAMAIWRGPGMGFLFGALIGLAQFLQFPSLAPRAWLDFVCMMLVPTFAGLVAAELDKLMTQRDRNQAVAAALAERERLNRIVHDGVLQVLAMVEREGDELGPKGQRLANLAGEQESKLRGLLQDKGIDLDGLGLDEPPSAPEATMTDVVSLVARHESPSVSVSVMAGAVAMPTARAQELDAAISEVLSNVAKHAGAGAHAWVLLEEDDGELIVSLRDNGVGVTAEQLDQAAQAGRMGVQESIRGRIRALGGTCGWRSEPGSGLEWEFRMPIGE
jgi:signal transduction histidine kinase